MAQRCPCETGWLGVHTAQRPRWILRNRLLQLAHALNGIGLRVLCVRLEVRSGRCKLARDASGLALHPSVKGYCRPDLPAHYREKFGFVLWRMVTDQRQKGRFLSRGESLRGVAAASFLATGTHLRLSANCHMSCIGFYVSLHCICQA